MVGDLQNQVDFRTGRCPIEPRNGALWRDRQQVLDNKTLPACAHHGMAEQACMVRDAEQCVDDAAVPDE